MWQFIFVSYWFNFPFCILLFFFVGAGVLCAGHYKKKHKWENSGIENAVVGIFGLIISFTFLQAGNAHRERYAYIHKQANNIDMLYRYSKEMPDSFRRKTKLFLLTFINYQITYKKQANDEVFFANVREIIDSYWSQLGYFKKQSTSTTNANQ